VKQIINKDEVGKAIADLVSKGKKPTLAAVHAALNNRGSMSTIVRLKAEIEAAAQPITESSDALKAFREVWGLAVGEGQKQQEAILGELRESVKALATENERLEGTAMAAQNHAAELQLEKSRIETELSRVKSQADEELKQAKTSHAQAATQAAEALQKLAESQAAHAVQVVTLQTELTATVRKAHDLELQLVRAVALLEGNGIEPTMESRRPRHTKETKNK
jgi:chromosome segregation ATPase